MNDIYNELINDIVNELIFIVNGINVSNERFNKAVDALYQSMPRWVDVKDRLPELEKDVLVTDGKTIQISYLWRGWFGDEYEDKFSKADLFICPISHWMELPEPPESEE